MTYRHPDLTVSDASATRDLCRQVAGWSVQNLETKDRGELSVDSNMIDEAGKPAAGICHAGGANLGLPPV